MALPFHIPEEAEKYGFIINGFGAHSGRTIMFKEMSRLFSAYPNEATNNEYAEAILDNNILLKKSGASRNETFSRLQRLYGLDKSILLFKISKQLWGQETDAQPTLLLLFAIARDPILRVSVDLVLDTQKGGILVAPDFEDIVAISYLDQLKTNTLASIGRNIASSWTQSGHFEGRSRKVRVAVESFPTSVAFALFLGYLCGDRGEKLFYTNWVRILDTPVHELHAKAQLASQQGWLEYKQAGQITEITFNHLLHGVEL